MTPKSADSVYVDETATAVGDVTIGPEASATVGYNAIVHGGTVGARRVVEMGRGCPRQRRRREHCPCDSTVTEATSIPDDDLLAGTPADIVKYLDGSGGRTGATTRTSRSDTLRPPAR